MIKSTQGSVIGKYHLGIGKNNQDAALMRVYGDKFVGIVCDGCGSCERSEVGSNIGANFVLKEIESVFLVEPADVGCLDLLKFNEVKQHVTLLITDLAYKMRRDLFGAIKDYLLFTIVGVFSDGENVCVFSIGDGFYAINGNVHQIGPFEHNMPPYIAYNSIPNFVSKEIDPAYLDFNIHEVLPLSKLQSVLIGTDGVGDLIEASNKNIPGKKELVGSLDQFWTNDLYFKNSSALDRRLTLINREFSVAKDGWLQHEKGHLKDDTTMIVFRKFEE